MAVSPAKDVADDTIRRFADVYEPSGAEQLDDGRIIVVEDEPRNPVKIITVGNAGELIARPAEKPSLLAMAMGASAAPAPSDLEGLAQGPDGYIYAITSHSRTGSGKRDDDREALVRFRMDGDTMAGSQVVKRLRKAITKTHDTLDDAAHVRDVKDDNGFNIEGLAFDAARQNLLIGLRSPVIDKRAIIVVVTNPAAMFDADEKPAIAPELIRLDLDKGGIRGMVWDAGLGGYLILSHRESGKKKPFKIWFWDGMADHAPRRVHIAGGVELDNAEGITPVHLDGRDQFLIVFDDGNRAKAKGGHYLLIDRTALTIDPG